MPTLELRAELIFFGVLPPLLYGAAFFTSLRDLRATVRPIGLLAIGLVVVTTVGVAVVAHAFIDGLTWPSAFVLGAIVSPTDPLAATTIARRLGVPRKLVTIVEGESLVNDGTGLVPVPGRDRGRPDGFLLRGADGRALRRRRGGRRRRRARGRLDRASGTAPAGQPSGRGHDLTAHGLFRVHPGRPPRCLGRARGRHRRASTSAGTRPS